MDNISKKVPAEYAAVVAEIQSQNIEITPEMQRRADLIRGVASSYTGAAAKALSDVQIDFTAEDFYKTPPVKG
jgi:hypothetical protein